MSYLGKISALVTVNTGDVAPKLNATAKSVQSFAKNVERDIGSSMRSAAKSLESIYTPLQRLERSLRAASSMKLSFGGFPGAIRDLDSLKQRLTSLNQRQINVVLKTSGVRSISAFREALSGISSKEFSFIARVGGVEKLRELREAVAAGGGEFSVTARLGDANAKVESLRKRLDEAKVAGSSVSVVVDASRVSAARSELERATAALRTFAGGMSDIESITPSALSGEIGGRLVEAENKLIRLKGRKGAKPSDIAAAEQERDAAASAAAELATLRAKESAARRALRDAERGEQTGGPREQRRIARDLRSAEKERREALAEAQRVYRDVVGVDLTPKDIEKLTRGGSTALDDLLSRATRSQAAMLKAGGSGDFVDVVRNRVMPALGRSDLNANAEKARQTALAAETITKPLAGVKDRLMASGRDIEAAYLPALSRTQAAAQALNDTIEASGGAAADVRKIGIAFGDVERQIRRDTAAVQQFGEARAAIGALKTGKELVFASPELSEVLGRGAAIGRSAASLPASALAGNSGIADSLAKIYGLSEKAAAAFARLRALQNSDLPTDKAQARLDALIAKLRKAQDEASKAIKVEVDTAAAKASLEALSRAAIAANDRLISQERELAQERARSAAAARASFGESISRAAAATFQPAGDQQSDIAWVASGLSDQFSRLQAAARSAFGLPEYQTIASALGRARVEIQGIESEFERLTALDPQRDIEEYRDAWARVESRIRGVNDLMIGGVRLSEDATRAARERKEVEQESNRFREDATFTITGRVQNADQIKKELSRLLAAVGELDEAERSAFAPDLNRLSTIADLRRPEDIDEARSIISSTDARLGSSATAAAARKRVSQIDSVWDAAIRNTPTTQAQLDAEFSSLEARIQRLDVGDRLSLDPLIADFRASVAAGQPLVAQFDRLLAVRRELEGIEFSRDVPTAVQEIPLPPGFGGSSSAGLGPAVDDPTRQFDRLRSEIVSTKSAIDSLPVGMRARFATELAQIEGDFKRMGANGIEGAADELEQLDARVKAVAASVAGATSASGFSKRFDLDGLNRSLDARRLQGWTAQLEMMETVLARLTGGGLARGSLAMQRLVQGIDEARSNGTLSEPATVRRLNALRDEVAGEIAGERGSGTTAKGFRRQLTRVGDIGRMGADKFSLALNQAAFAIDDFMSSTGGVEFKLRAISNNITQLAFVLGGTTGLFIGLGAVIGAQAAVAISKWINSGQSAEDRTKALNDSLSKQKTLVSDLAQAYKSLESSLLKGTMASGAENAIETNRSLRAAAEKRREQLREPIVSLSPSVVSERTAQAALQKRFDAAETVGERAAIQKQIDASRRREVAAVTRAGGQPAPDDVVVRSGIRGAITELQRFAGNAGFGLSNVLQDIGISGEYGIGLGGLDNESLLSPEAWAAKVGAQFGFGRSRQGQIAEAVAGMQGAMANMPTGMSAESRTGQISALERAISALVPLTSQRNFGMFKSSSAVKAENAIAGFQQQIEQIRQSSASGMTAAVDTTFANLQAAADNIRSAQEAVADAISRGVPNAGNFQAQLNTLSSELTAAYQDLVKAQTVAEDDNGRPMTPKQREDAVARAQARVEAVRTQQGAIDQRAFEMRVGRTFGGERAASALSSLQSGGSASIQQTRAAAVLRGSIAAESVARERMLRAISAEAAITDQLTSLEQKRQSETSAVEAARQDAEIAALRIRRDDAAATREAAVAAADQAARLADANAALAEFIVSIEKSVSRIASIGDAAIQASTRGADAAQQAVVENPFRAGVVEARDAAEGRLIEDRALVERARNRLNASIEQARQDPRMQAIAAERKRLEDEAKNIAADVAAGKRGPEAAGDAEARANKLTELDRDQARVMQELTAARRREYDAILSGITAREREIDRSRQRDAEEPTFTRRRRQIDAGLSAAEQAADEAQQRFIQQPTDENFVRRNQAETQLREARQKAQSLQDNLDSARESIERSDPIVRGGQARLAAIDAERAAIREKAMTEGRGNQLTGDELARIEALNAEEAGVRRGVEDRKSLLLKPQQDEADRFAREQELRARATRGKDLGMTERERFRKEMEEGVGAEIRARAGQLQGQGIDPTAYMNQAIAEQAKQIAPMFDEFRMERENALLQGPSRAALQVSDVTTTQGQSELNRLIRGDDPAKDVNLAELRKQNDKLDILIGVVKANGLQVVN